jgi:hypothetical protein
MHPARIEQLRIIAARGIYSSHRACGITSTSFLLTITLGSFGFIAQSVSATENVTIAPYFSSEGRHCTWRHETFFSPSAIDARSPLGEDHLRELRRDLWGRHAATLKLGLYCGAQSNPRAGDIVIIEATGAGQIKHLALDLAVRAIMCDCRLDWVA